VSQNCWSIFLVNLLAVLLAGLVHFLEELEQGILVAAEISYKDSV